MITYYFIFSSVWLITAIVVIIWTLIVYKDNKAKLDSGRVKDYYGEFYKDKVAADALVLKWALRALYVTPIIAFTWWLAPVIALVWVIIEAIKVSKTEVKTND